MPRLVDHDEQRDQLAEACLRLFARKGFAAVTMRELATANGVSTGKFYHYFPNKQAILMHLFSTSADRDLGALADVLPADADAHARRAAFLAFVDAAEERLRNLVLVAIDVHRHHEQGLPGTPGGLLGVVQSYMENIGRWLGLTTVADRERVLRAVIGALLHRATEPESAPVSARVFEV